MNTMMMQGHVMDTSGLKLVQPPGLRSPRQRVSYDDRDVQDNLHLAFDGILPWMEAVDTDNVRYFRDDGSGRDTCAESVPVESKAAIPKGEMLRLMEGWIMLRKLAQNPNLPPGMDAMLLNFRIPDPRRAPTFYRVYKCAKTGRQKMHVCWGFESAKLPSIPIDRAVAAVFGVPIENIGSLLATSLVNHTTGHVPLGQTTTVVQAPAAHEARPGPWKWVAGGLATAVVVMAVALVFTSGSKAKDTVPSPVEPAAKAEASLKGSVEAPLAAVPAVPTPVPVVPVQAAPTPVVAAPSPAPAPAVPMPSLDAAASVARAGAPTPAKPSLDAMAAAPAASGAAAPKVTVPPPVSLDAMLSAQVPQPVK